MKQVLSATGHKDTNVMDDVVRGFRITGDLGRTGVFEAKDPEQVKQGDSQEWLWAQARGVRESLVLSFAEPRPFDHVAREVAKNTREEVEKGWASGPFTTAQLDDALGPCWVPSRRFGVLQGTKVRPIDDFSESMVNNAVTIREKVTVQGVDHIAAVAKMWTRLLQKENVEVTLSSGEFLRGRRHASFSADTTLAGKRYDLESAYKQCPLSGKDQSVGVVAVRTEEKSVQFFRLHVLPFGAAGSVVGFNRVALALKAMAVEELLVPALNYYDDFPVIIPVEVAGAVEKAMKGIEAATGWRWKGLEKDIPFSEDFEALGVVLELPKQGVRHLRISNTKARVDELVKQLSDVVTSGRIRSVEAARLASRLTFAASQLCGRTGAAVMWHLRQASRGPAVRRVSGELAVSIAAWREAISSGSPRCVPLVPGGRPAILFTDGYCDPQLRSAGFGAVLLDWETGTFESFGSAVRADVFTALSDLVGADQIVCQAELLAILAARVAWVDVLRRVQHRRILCFVDNDAARFGLMKGYSPSRASSWLLAQCWRADIEAGTFCWFDRVASASNPADGPSRLSFGSTRGLLNGGIRVVPPPQFEDALLASFRSIGA